MEDPSFHINGIKIINDILSYFYLGLVIMCFILALGNRPQGSKWGYTGAFIGFALITIYMTVRTISLPSSSIFLGLTLVFHTTVCGVLARDQGNRKHRSHPESTNQVH